MKKKVLFISAALLLYIAIRFLFFYTIFDVPYKYGMKTYTGNDKYYFPICVINPVKIKNIENRIHYYLKDTTEESYLRSIADDIRWFFETPDNYSDFKIVSVNTSEKKENSFLLQRGENPNKKCVVFFDKKTNKLLRFGF